MRKKKILELAHLTRFFFIVGQFETSLNMHSYIKIIVICFSHTNVKIHNYLKKNNTFVKMVFSLKINKKTFICVYLLEEH